MIEQNTHDQLPVVNIEKVLETPELTDINGPRGEFHATLGLIGKALGTKNIGVNVTVVQPEKKSLASTLSLQER